MRFLTIVLTVLATGAWADPNFWRHEWPNTNFEMTSVENWVEILSGGPPKDGIPALSDPEFIDVGEETRLTEREPVIALELPGEAPRAYPVRYLMWHEIVNDEVGGVPVAVTFCPLCNSGITFDRRVEQGVLTFGVSGKLRFFGHGYVLIARTESWWQTGGGRGDCRRSDGDRAADASVVDGKLGRVCGAQSRRDGDGSARVPAQLRRKPLCAIRTPRHRPFLFSGEMPPYDIPALARVIRVGDRAWPMTRVAEGGEVSEAGVVLSWTAGQASALDEARIGQGRDVGTVRVQDGAGEDLAHDVMFAFAFHAFLA